MDRRARGSAAACLELATQLAAGARARGTTPAGGGSVGRSRCDPALEVRRRALLLERRRRGQDHVRPAASPRSGSSADTTTDSCALQRVAPAARRAGRATRGSRVAEQHQHLAARRARRGRGPRPDRRGSRPREPRARSAPRAAAARRRPWPPSTAASARSSRPARSGRGSVTSSTGRSAASSARPAQSALSTSTPGAVSMCSLASRSSCVPPAPTRTRRAPRRIALRMRNSITPASPLGSRSPAITITSAVSRSAIVAR